MFHSQIFDGTKFGLERHLHEFMRDNWTYIDLSEEWILYEEDGDPEAGYEYPTDIGRIDLLAKHKNEQRWLVIELKRNKSTDKTVGQLLRYMGWVRKELASQDDGVEGLVISKDVDNSMHYALEMTPNMRLQLYEVNFRLKSVNFDDIS